MVLIREQNPEIFIRNAFRDYYRSWSPDPVDLIHQREIGFIPFMGTMIRHRSVMGMKDLKGFGARTVPRHLYYSTAYYRKPEERIMADKEWMGAELIFDLDADHIKVPGNPRYDQILDVVREHTLRLLERFLLSDIGIDPESILVTFSGGRGYHIHVKSESIYNLNSDSRREITNYIRGEGLDSASFPRMINDGTGITGTWRQEIDREFCKVFTDIETSQNSILREALGDGRRVNPYVSRLRKTAVGSSAESKLSVFSRPGPDKYLYMDEQDKLVLAHIISQVREEIMCEIDEPVTTDIHRLIRLPGSLHGKTGLVVTPLNVDELRHYDPLSECRAKIWADSTVNVFMESGYTIRFGGEIQNIKSGEAEVPLDLGIFLLAQRKAKLV